MAILEVIKYPNPILRSKNKIVTAFNDDLKKLIEDMYETMYANDGLGLAAPQVGINLMVAVVDYEGKKYTLVNPVILEKRGEQTGREGCLSFPEVFEDIERPEIVKIQAFDENGKKYAIEASGLLARAFCHEIDHLHGRLMIDMVSPVKRNMIQKKFKKLKKGVTH
ncbi:MAG: peptide deformylase [Acetomicrobium sp.]